MINMGESAWPGAAIYVVAVAVAVAVVVAVAFAIVVAGCCWLLPRQPPSQSGACCPGPLTLSPASRASLRRASRVSRGDAEDERERGGEGFFL